jgi:hypothetical protein
VGFFVCFCFLFFAFIFFFIFGGWTQALALTRQALCYLSHTPSPFCFSYFLVLFFAQADLNRDSPTYISCPPSLDECTPAHPTFFVGGGGLTNFLLWLALIHELPNIHLPCSLDCRHESLCLASGVIFVGGHGGDWLINWGLIWFYSAGDRTQVYKASTLPLSYIPTQLLLLCLLAFVLCEEKPSLLRVFGFCFVWLFFST